MKAPKEPKFTPAQKRWIDVRVANAQQAAYETGRSDEFKAHNDRSVAHAVVLNGQLQALLAELSRIIAGNTPSPRGT